MRKKKKHPKLELPVVTLYKARLYDGTTLIQSSDRFMNNRLFMTCRTINSLLLTVLLLQPGDYGLLNETSHKLFLLLVAQQLPARKLYDSHSLSDTYYPWISSFDISAGRCSGQKVEMEEKDVHIIPSVALWNSSLSVVVTSFQKVKRISGWPSCHQVHRRETHCWSEPHIH